MELISLSEIPRWRGRHGGCNEALLIPHFLTKNYGILALEDTPRDKMFVSKFISLPSTKSAVPFVNNLGVYKVSFIMSPTIFISSDH